MTRAALALAALVAGALLAGCSGTTELEARVIRDELWIQRLERQVEELRPLALRVHGLETLQSAPPPADRQALEARLAALEAALEQLRAELRATGAPPALQQPERGDGPTELPPPPGATDARAPGPGQLVPVLSVGSGSTILVQGQGGLLRVELHGLEAPARAEEYAASPLLGARHQPALGPAALEDDAAFERSRAHLQELLSGGQVSLEYPLDAAPAGAGAVRAFVSVRGEQGPLDVNAAMLRDGFALAAAGGHARARQYAALEAEARAAHRGLFAGR